MGLLGSLVSVVVKTALTPVAVVVDVTDVLSGNEANNTKQLVESAVEDLKEGLNNL